MENFKIPQEFIDQGEKLLSLFGWNFLAAIAIFVVGQIISKIICSIFKKILIKANVDDTVVGFMGKLLYGIMIIIVTLTALSKLGIQTNSFLAVIGSAGLAIGLALQGSLTNFAAGILLLVLRPFKKDHFIEVAGIAGVVEEIYMLNTQLRTPDNKTIFVPNSGITNGNLVNYSIKKTRRIDLIIGVSYDDDLALVKKTLETLVAADEKVLKDVKVVIGVSELANSSINFVVRPWVNTADFWEVKFRLLENIKNEFDRIGITIPYPQQDVHIHNEKA